LIKEIKKIKSGTGPDILIFGSGTIISQLAAENLIDTYMMVMNPVYLGTGRTMFEGVKKMKDLKLTDSRIFKNGKVLLNYVPA
jgi:dihydrofolate reductase